MTRWRNWTAALAAFLVPLFIQLAVEFGGIEDWLREHMESGIGKQVEVIILAAFSLGWCVMAGRFWRSRQPVRWIGCVLAALLIGGLALWAEVQGMNRS